MSRKILKFSINQLIVQDKLFNIKAFSAIRNEDVEKNEIIRRETKERELLSIKKIEKEISEDRFICIYFRSGDKFPYSDKVINADLEEQENPRSPEEIEIKDQLFILIDPNTQRIFIPDLKKKTFFKVWLKEKLDKEIVIKPIILEEQFTKKIKSVEKIYFSAVPNLFNSGGRGILSEKLVEDINGFDAQKASIELKYNGKKITEKIIEKMNFLKEHKSEFEEITIIGRDEENFESIFNMNEVNTKIAIEVERDDRSKLLNKNIVFEKLINKIKSHEKNI